MFWFFVFLIFLLPLYWFVRRWWKRPVSNYWYAWKISEDDPLLEQAALRAQQSFPQMKELYHDPNRPEITVKFRFDTSDGTTEYLYGDLDDILQGNVLRLELLTQPIDHEEDLPPFVDIPLKEVRDWQCDLEDEKIRGGFVPQAMMEIYKREKGRLPLRMQIQRNHYMDSLEV